MSSRSPRPAAPPAGAPALVWALVLAAGTLGVLGCGKKGDPAPPFRAVPAPIADLVVVQRGNRLLFQVTHPRTTVAGRPSPAWRASSSGR